jgi:hypothetical protein
MAEEAFHKGCHDFEVFDKVENKQGTTHRCLEVEPLLNTATPNGFCVRAVC